MVCKRDMQSEGLFKVVTTYLDHLIRLEWFKSNFFIWGYQLAVSVHNLTSYFLVFLSRNHRTFKSCKTCKDRCSLPRSVLRSFTITNLYFNTFICKQFHFVLKSFLKPLMQGIASRNDEEFKQFLSQVQVTVLYWLETLLMYRLAKLLLKHGLNQFLNGTWSFGWLANCL